MVQLYELIVSAAGAWGLNQMSLVIGRIEGREGG